MKKKIISLIICLAVACSSMLMVSAAPAASLKADKTSVEAGDTVSIAVEVADLGAVGSIGAVLNFDTNVFEFVSAELHTGGLMPNVDPAQFAAFDAFSPAKNIDGKVATFVLNVKADAASGDSEVKATVNYDGAAEPMLASVKVTVAGGEPVEEKNVLHVSYDEVRPGIICGNNQANILTPAVETGTTEVTFWGWIAFAKDLKGFSYSVNKGEKVASEKFETEQPVLDAAAGVAGAVGGSRFKVIVPSTEGTQLVEIFAEFADGTSEAFWVAELTVGEPTDLPDFDEPSEPTEKPSEPTEKPSEPTEKPSEPTEKPSEPTEKPADKEDNVETGDILFVIVIAAAAFVVTILSKKRVF